MKSNRRYIQKCRLLYMTSDSYTTVSIFSLLLVLQALCGCETCMPVSQCEPRMRNNITSMKQLSSQLSCTLLHHAPSVRYTYPLPFVKIGQFLFGNWSPRFYLKMEPRTLSRHLPSPLQFWLSCKIVLPSFPPLILTLPKNHISSS